MKGIRPCPYCGGEVEVVKLPKKRYERKYYYRIECRICHKLVSRGLGFPNETPKEAQQRIKEYEEFVDKSLNGVRSTKIRQTLEAERRDRKARMSSRADPENEFEY